LSDRARGIRPLATTDGDRTDDREVRLATEEERRYSEGLEETPETPEKVDVPRFSEGMEEPPETAEEEHEGRFSEGLEETPQTAEKAERRRFSEGLERDPHSS
jgi:hypothetical protein